MQYPDNIDKNGSAGQEQPRWGAAADRAAAVRIAPRGARAPRDLGGASPADSCGFPTTIMVGGVMIGLITGVHPRPCGPGLRRGGMR